MQFEHPDEALQRANANIRAVNEKIRQQSERIREMNREGFDTALALRALGVMCDARDASLQRRELILERMNLAAQRSRSRLPTDWRSGS